MSFKQYNKSFKRDNCCFDFFSNFLVSFSVLVNNRKGIRGSVLTLPLLFQKDQIGYRFTLHQPEIFDSVRTWRSVLDEYESKDGKVR